MLHTGESAVGEKGSSRMMLPDSQRTGACFTFYLNLDVTCSRIPELMVGHIIRIVQ